MLSQQWLLSKVEDNMLIALCILVLIFAAIAAFLGSELLKKFNFMRHFTERSPMMVCWYYSGNRKPGMYNIVLRAEKPFKVLVGFILEIPILAYKGYDYYGFVESDLGGNAVIRTYLGKGECDFRFLIGHNGNTILPTVSSTEADQELVPNGDYPPHWFQRIGFYS